MADDLSTRPQQPLADLGPVLGELLHDLANEVQILHGWAVLARGEVSLGRTGGPELDRVLDLSGRMGEMLRDVVDTVGGKVVSPEVEFDPVAVTEALLNERVREMAALEVELVIRVPPGVRVRGRTTFWTRTLGNLLGNAVRYARRRVRLVLEVEWQGEREWVAARVEDDGPGVAAEERARIFEPLWRGARGQTGLGLSAASWLASQLGGSIRYAEDNTLGGAAFALRVPTTTTLTSARPGALASRPVAPLRGLRLLVVDDDRELRTTVGKLLRRVGADVRELDPTGEPMDWVTENLLRASPDVLILGLGERCGVALWQRLRDQLPRLADRVVFASGAVPGDPQWDAAEATGQPVLPKPFELEQLRRAVERVRGAG